MSHRRRRSKNSSPLRDFVTACWTSQVCRVLAGVVVLGGAIFAVYAPSMHGGFLMDDDNLLTANALISSPNGLYQIWFTNESPDYWPVSNTSLWIEWRLWGSNPTGYHVTNDLLHVMTCLLLWLVLHRLSIPGAFLAALLYAVHPVNVESIAWIAQRKDAMAVVFFMLSVFGFVEAELRGMSRGASQVGGVRGDGLKASGESFYPPGVLRWHLFSLIMFVLAVLSKGSAVILPLVLVIVIFWRRRPSWRDGVRLAPFFVIAAALTLVNIWFQTHGGAPVRPGFGPVNRLLQAGVVTCFYLNKALVPLNLLYVYPLWNIDWRVFWWWLPTVATILMTVCMGFLSRHRPAWGRPVFFAWLFFLAALFPMMGFTDIAYMRFCLVADHYQHIALLGVVTLLAAGARLWYDRTHGLFRGAAVATSAAAVVSLAVLCFQQNGLYKDANTLYKATIKNNPTCAVLYNELGRIATNNRNLAEAVLYYEQAIAAWPGYAEPHNNLAIVLDQLGYKNEAVRLFQKALMLGGTDYGSARMNLASMYAACGRLPELMAQCKELLRQNPKNATARLQYGEALIVSGKVDEGVEMFKGIRTYHCDNFVSENATGVILFKANRIPEAVDAFQRAIQLNPAFLPARMSLAAIYRKLNRTADALKEYEAVVCQSTDRPETIDAYRGIAEIDIAEGRINGGIAMAKKAASLARSKDDQALATEIELWIDSCQRAKKSK
ncbi:MAG: tetratricopeptide repeat protein [Thermoguttaceae bacterium]